MAAKEHGSSSGGNGADEREGAEIVRGAEALSKFGAVLQKFGFPAGMFPLPSVDEFGFVEKTGAFWIKQPGGRHEHTFPRAKEVVVYMADVSGRIQQGKITRLKGWKMKPVHHKDLFLSASATEVWLDDPPSGTIHFHVARKAKKSSAKASSHVKESFPLDVFATPAAAQ